MNEYLIEVLVEERHQELLACCRRDLLPRPEGPLGNGLDSADFWARVRGWAYRQVSRLWRRGDSVKPAIGCRGSLA